MCNKGVGVRIKCDISDLQYHRACLNLTAVELNRLGSTDTDCQSCTESDVLPNVTDSFFDGENSLSESDNSIKQHLSLCNDEFVHIKHLGGD